MLPVILALAQFAPAVIGLLTKDSTASKAVAMVSQTAQVLTGTSSDTLALAALKKSPELQLQYRTQMDTHAAQIYAEETKRLEMVNDTMRVEYANSDWYVRRMRPTFGYAVIYCLVLMFTTITGVALLANVDKAVKMIEAYAEMEWVIVGALAAIGVYIKKRSDDKKPPLVGLGFINKLMNRGK